MNIFGERKYWEDLFKEKLSRWVNVPAVDVRAIAVFASSTPDETMPSKDAIREVQQQAGAGLSAIDSGASSLSTLVGHVGRDGRDVL